MDNEEEFLAGIEDIPGDESGSSQIYKSAGQASSPSGIDGTPSSGIPIGGVGGGSASRVDPMSVSTPRRRVVAHRSKPWVRGDESASFMDGSGMRGGFNETPSPKIEKQAGPVDNRIREINEGETGQGFVGTVKVDPHLSMKDEEGGRTQGLASGVDRGKDIYNGDEQEEEFAEKLAKVQIISKKTGGAKLYTYAEFKHEIVASVDAYKRYLEKRCYACTDVVEQGVMCHECYASASSTKTAAGYTKNPVVPTGNAKADGPSRIASEMTEDGQDTAKFHDEAHYKAQEAAIVNDPVGAPKEKATLKRDNEKTPKPDKDTMERYAKESPKTITVNGKVYVEASEAAIIKEVPLQRPKNELPGMDQKYLSHGEKIQTDEVEGDAGNDYVGKFKGAQVVEYGYDGPRVVNKDYHGQTMKQSGDVASVKGIPQSTFASTFVAPDRGVPVTASFSGIPISSSGVADSGLAKKAGVKESALKIGDKVTSDKFEGDGEVMEIIRGDDGSMIGAAIDAVGSLITVASQFLKRGNEDYKKIIEDPEDPTKVNVVVDEDPALQTVDTEEESTGDKNTWKKEFDLRLDVSEINRLKNL